MANKKILIFHGNQSTMQFQTQKSKIMTFEQIRQFDEVDWIFERSSGYAGYRNTITDEWRYAEDYNNIRYKKIALEEKLKFLHDFRSECLEFGKYPDCVLLEFLKKRLELK